MRLPSSVLEELACNARFTGIIYDRRGRPIWRAHSVRRATKAQRQLLIARDGGCFACGAHADICDAHHVRPVSQGGATSLDNMVLACWRCHNKIHHLGWQIHGPPGNRTLHPPEMATHGPAHTPEPPGPNTPHTRPRLEPPSTGRATRRHPESAQTEPAIVRPGPKPARATLRAALQGAAPEPLFTPD